MTRGIRSDVDLDAAGFAAAVEIGAADSSVGGAISPTGLGDGGGASAVVVVGAGMNVTAADGDAERRRWLGDGDAAALCTGEGLALRFGEGGGLGSGGGGTTDDGELDARGALAGLAAGVARGWPLGLGAAATPAGCAAAGDATSTVGDSTATAIAISVGRPAVLPVVTRRL